METLGFLSDISSFLANTEVNSEFTVAMWVIIIIFVVGIIIALALFFFLWPKRKRAKSKSPPYRISGDRSPSKLPAPQKYYTPQNGVIPVRYVKESGGQYIYSQPVSPSNAPLPPDAEAVISRAKMLIDEYSELPSLPNIKQAEVMPLSVQIIPNIKTETLPEAETDIAIGPLDGPAPEVAKEAEEVMPQKKPDKRKGRAGLFESYPRPSSLTKAAQKKRAGEDDLDDILSEEII